MLQASTPSLVENKETVVAGIREVSPKHRTGHRNVLLKSGTNQVHQGLFSPQKGKNMGDTLDRKLAFPELSHQQRTVQESLHIFCKEAALWTTLIARQGAGDTPRIRTLDSEFETRVRQTPWNKESRASVEKDQGLTRIIGPHGKLTTVERIIDPKDSIVCGGNDPLIF
jgi:hypothetical protein